MNAPAPSTDTHVATRLSPMRLDEIDEVHAIEVSAYSFPWTRGNLIDSLVAGHHAQVLRDEHGELLGYWIAMPVLDEMHLLNLAVAPAHQRRGHAVRLLDALLQRCRALGMRSLWLEVRESNQRAQALYARYGLVPVGRRRGYYPAGHGRREDAVLMRMGLDAGETAGGGDALD